MTDFDIYYREEKPLNINVSKLRAYIKDKLSKAINSVPITSDRETLLHYANDIVQDLNSINGVHAAVQDDLNDCHVLSQPTANKGIIINVEFKSSVKSILLPAIINYRKSL